MEQIIDQQSSTISFILAERTKAQWQDSPEFVSLIEPLWHLDEAPIVPDLNYLMKLMHLTCEADEEQSNRLFLLLESYCAIAEPQVFAEVLARLMLEGGEGYPSSTSKTGEGWLGWALDYKPELARKGQMARRLWKMAQQRGEDIEKLALQSIVASLIRQQEFEKEAQSQVQQSGNSRDVGQDAFKYSSSRMHDVLYMLHCGPLADQCLPLWDDESVLNALVKLRDGGDQRSLENQLLGLANLLDRFFSWIESKDYEECVEQLKLRIASYTKTPELFAFAMDAIMRYLDGRWIRSEFKDEGIAKPKAISTSLIEINREREPIHYMTTDPQGGYGFSESKNAIKGKSLKERELPTSHDRGPSTRQFEVADLISRCFEGHEAGEIEQLLRRLISHLTIRVDTAMISASSAMIKHTAQQR
ncbi:hypothetical protein BGZ58_007371 [Dissophora ornata]|nr:hypothetical protein BGZ58_007371 [Dissophora ornata]